MAFRFKRKEDFADGFSRIASAQIERALREWDNADRAVAVHETRKCIKRLRALLRLVEPALPKSDFRAENAFLRDVASALSVSRDLQVMSETLARLNNRASADEAQLLSAIADSIAAAMVGEHPESEPNPKKTSKALRQAGKRLSNLRPSATGFDVVGAGFEKTYRQGRRRMRELAARHSDEASHDWRKRVQAHWRQLVLLRPAWPDYFDARIARARALSESLGQDHDLAVLADYVAGPAGEALGREGAEAVCRLIAETQEEIRARTLDDGRLLFADKPKALTEQVQRYWEVAATSRPPRKQDEDHATEGAVNQDRDDG